MTWCGVTPLLTSNTALPGQRAGCPPGAGTGAGSETVLAAAVFASDISAKTALNLAWPLPPPPPPAAAYDHRVPRRPVASPGEATATPATDSLLLWPHAAATSSTRRSSTRRELSVASVPAVRQQCRRPDPSRQSVANGRLAVCRLAVCRLAVCRLAVCRLAVCRLAVCRLAVCRLASQSLAVHCCSPRSAREWSALL